MHLPLSLIRTIFYVLIIVWSVLAFIFAAAFVGLTQSRWDYYYESSVELLVTSILALAALPVLHFVFHRKGKPAIVTSAVAELVVVAILWLLYLGGAAAMADALPGLRGSFCDSSVCHTGRALQAFSWLAWITLTLQLALAITVLVLNSRADKSAWRQPLSQSDGTMTKPRAPDDAGASAQPAQDKTGMSHAEAAPPVLQYAPASRGEGMYESEVQAHGVPQQHSYGQA
ncbi:hypothetical protein OIO90_002267 [Microbotryomycetes sp. JL221]|nr:hypothetical protein OIO90_002267 [Microbotryomycetes sp. JL221]